MPNWCPRNIAATQGLNGDMSEFSELGLKYRNLIVSAQLFCVDITVVIAQLNNGVPADSEMIKAGLNAAMDNFVKNTNGEISKDAKNETRFHPVI